MKGRSVLNLCAESVQVRLDLKELPAEHVLISNESLETVNKFCYLGDITAARGVEESIVARIVAGRNLSNICIYFYFSLLTKGNIFIGCMQSVVLYCSETWEVKEEDLVKMRRNDMMMVQ